MSESSDLPKDKTAYPSQGLNPRPLDLQWTALTAGFKCAVVLYVWVFTLSISLQCWILQDSVSFYGKCSFCHEQLKLQR